MHRSQVDRSISGAKTICIVSWANDLADLLKIFTQLFLDKCDVNEMHHFHIIANKPIKDRQMYFMQHGQSA